MKGFGKKPATKEVLKESKRDITAATRQLEKELHYLQAEEKKLVIEIKKTAATGNQAATRVLAKNLVRIRQNIAQIHGSKAAMTGIASHASTMQANAAVAGAMKGAAGAMGAVNKQMDPVRMQKMAEEFARETGKAEMAEDMLSSAVGDALDGDEVEGEADDVTNQILDEIGIDVQAQLAPVPRTKLPSKARVDEAESSAAAEEDDLEQRLAALRSY